MKGQWGIAVDVISGFATIVGVATTLGFGAVQINGGFTFYKNSNIMKMLKRFDKQIIHPPVNRSKLLCKIT